MDLSRHNGHPRFFGYVASPSTPIGAYGDLIASALNANITCWRSGPAGTELERMVVRWLGSLIGYDTDAKGLLTSGGSMANMIALLIASVANQARTSRARSLERWATDDVYASSEVHMSIAKAADILGFGRDQVRVIAMRRAPAMRVDLLRENRSKPIEAKDLRPFCVVGSAGTVNTGVVDPLAEIARLPLNLISGFTSTAPTARPVFLTAQERSLCRSGASRFSFPRSTQVALCSGRCRLSAFRDATAAKSAFSTEDADYIKTHGYVTKRLCVLGLWRGVVAAFSRPEGLADVAVLRERRLAEAISEDIALAAYLGELVSSADDFELLAPVELSICCFRYVPRARYERERTG
jgi:aromatic-L-amino-acid decarboxylase